MSADDDVEAIRRAVFTHEYLSDYTSGDLAAAIEKTSLAPLLADGVPVMDIAKVIIDGVATVEGVRLVLAEGTPVDWIRSFEDGAAR